MTGLSGVLAAGGGPPTGSGPTAAGSTGAVAPTGALAATGAGPAKAAAPKAAGPATPPAMPAAMDPGWADALSAQAPLLASMGAFLRAEVAAGRAYLPAGNHILRAFEQPLDQVRVLIVGQDPYPTPGHPVGLSFAVDRRVRPLPRSLVNIYTELGTDLGITAADHGDLTSWAEQGVLLLNRVLTVAPNQPASHRGKGWEQFTEAAIRALVARDAPLVAILWGKDAQTLRPLLGPVPHVASVHPSPLSAARGFFGSKPFSRANAMLTSMGADPVDWSVR